MNLRWLFGNYADPDYALPRKEQRELSDLAHQKFTAAGAFIWFTGLALAPLAVSLWLLPKIVRSLGMSGNWPHGVGVAIVIALFWPWCAWVYRFLYARPFRQAMRHRGYDVCVGCGYRLEGLGLEVERCPECGEPRPMPSGQGTVERE